MDNRMTFVEVLHRVAQIDCNVMNACNPEKVVIFNRSITLEAPATAKRITDLYNAGIELRRTTGQEVYFMANVGEETTIKLKA